MARALGLGLGLLTGLGAFGAIPGLVQSRAEAAPALEHAPGYMRDIDIGPNGKAFGIGGRDFRPGNGQVYRWTGTNWAPFGGWGTKVTVDRDGNPWLVNSSKEIWRHKDGRWSKLPGSAIDIDAGANGDVYMLAADNPRPGQGSVNKWNGSAWTSVGGYGKRITVDPHGNPWLVNGAQEIWRRQSGTWKKIPGRATAIDSGADGTVYLIGIGDAPAGNGKLYRWNGSGWTGEGGWGHTITVGHDGVPTVINSRDEIWSGMFDGRSAEEFGFGSLKVNGTKALGTSPMLVVLVEYQDVRFRAPHTPAYFEDLLFDGDRSLSGYFRENSGTAFQVRKAAMIGPVRHPLTFECAHRRSSCATRDSKGFLSNYAEILQQPSVSGNDFSRYDRNDDGRVTPDELLVLFVVALPEPLAKGGINRELPGGCTRVGSVQLCGKMALMGEGTGFATIAHEMSHSLETVDLYGARIRNNNRMTVMAGTVEGREDVHKYVHLDPWHKMRLGWTKPRIKMMSRGGKTTRITLAAPGVGGDDERPVLLYDPRKARAAPFEYFLIEYRQRTPGGTAGYDGDLASSGVVIWHIKQKANHALSDAYLVLEAGGNNRIDTPVAAGSDDVTSGLAIEAGPDRILQTRPRAGTDDRLGHDASNWVVSPPAGKLGVSRAWTSADGPANLKWLNNTSTFARVRALPSTANAESVTIEISYDH